MEEQWKPIIIEKNGEVYDYEGLYKVLKNVVVVELKLAVVIIGCIWKITEGIYE